MGKVWEYIYWHLPVGKRQFFDKANNLLEKADSLKQILESGVKNSYNHRNELYNQMSGKIDGLANEVKRLHEENARLERIITHYHKQDMQMFWQEYRKDGESTVDAQKRFFLALPKTQGVNRNLQLLEKDLLKAFVRICDEHQLFYWLYAGTLLGAVRHKGFIPWDDDIDTCMAREDIDKLREILKDNQEYRLTVRYDAWGFCKQIRFTYKDSPVPVFIDVFPFDWISEATYEKWEGNQKVKRELKSELTDESNPLIREFRKAGCVDADSTIGVQVSKIFDKYFNKLREENVVCDKKDAKGCLYSFDSWSYCDDRNIIAKDNFYPLKKIEFEGDKYYVPNNYIYILEELYGYDFYTFPCGEPHFIHADWKKNEKILEEEVKKRIK